MDTHDANPADQGYWPNDWPGHDPGYDPDRASIDEECAGMFAEREAPSRSGYRRASDDTWARARADYLAGETADSICARYGMGVSTLRNRAAAERWRRQDQPDPEPVDLDLEREQGLPVYADMAAHALVRLNRAILKGRAPEAASWMRIHMRLLDLDRKPAPKPAPPPAPKPNPLMDALEAQVAEIQALARSLAGGNSDDSDDSDGKNSSPPHLDGEGDRGAVEGAAVPCPTSPLSAPAVMSHGSTAPSVTTAAPPRHLPAGGEEMREAGSDCSDPSDHSDGAFHTPHPKPHAP